MLAFLQENIGTIVVLAILVAVVLLIIRSMVKSRKSGCGSGCAGCPHSSQCGIDAEK